LMRVYEKCKDSIKMSSRSRAKFLARITADRLA
jgi:hypothetical protein